MTKEDFIQHLTQHTNNGVKYTKQQAATFYDNVRKQPCIRCGSNHTIALAVCNPYDRKAFLAPKNKLRQVWYMLCEKCVTDPETPQIVEDGLFEHFSKLS